MFFSFLFSWFCYIICFFAHTANCIMLIVADGRPNESTIALCAVIKTYNHLLQVSVDLYVVVVFVVVWATFFLLFFLYIYIIFAFCPYM